MLTSLALMLQTRRSEVQVTLTGSKQTIWHTNIPCDQCHVLCDDGGSEWYLTIMRRSPVWVQVILLFPLCCGLTCSRCDRVTLISQGRFNPRPEEEKRPDLERPETISMSFITFSEGYCCFCARLGAELIHFHSLQYESTTALNQRTARKKKKKGRKSRLRIKSLEE